MMTSLVLSLGVVLLLGFGFRKLAETSRFQLLGNMVTQVNTQEKVVALTYDDGPNLPYTDQLMEVLAQFGVKATFFVIGRQVEQYTETVQALQKSGHELGNHSYSHRRLIATSRQTITDEIQRTDQLLQDLGSSREIPFRAPYGYKRIRLPWVLAQLNKVNVLWNIDPRDYQAAHADMVVNHVLEKVQPGSIILLHDGGGDRSLTVEATVRLIPQLQEQGYRFRTVSELLALQGEPP